MKELFAYDPETGVFTRARQVRSHICGKRAGYLQSSGYVYINVDGHRYRAHHLAWLFVHGVWPSRIDHRNGVRSDNRIDNLREATASQNVWNMSAHKRNTSGFKGVSKTTSGRWKAAIQANRVAHNLGTFDTPEEAHSAYCRAAEELHGEFKRTS